MTGMGIVALAGIVVRNGILLVEFTDVLKEQGVKTRQAIIQAGKTRITPVVLDCNRNNTRTDPSGNRYEHQFRDTCFQV
jgi:hypothetical protein